MHRASIAVVLSSIALIASPAFTQDDQATSSAPAIINPVSMDVEASISAVTLYRGRAAVTRNAPLQLEAGVYALRFADLPATAQPDSLQARAGTGLKVLSVDFQQQAVADSASSPAIVEIDQRIQQITQAIRAMADQRSLISSQEKFLDALTIRTTTDASAASGTSSLDLEEIRKQMQFITGERKRLNSEKASLDVEQPKLEAELEAAKANRNSIAAAASISRTAIVTVVAAAPFQGEITLTYLVNNATWQPAYNVRTAADLSSVQVEYDATLTQRTGEDWSDVRLTLSTAQPTIAANPPVIEPWYVDIARPASERGFTARMAEGSDAVAGRIEVPWQSAGDDASVAGSGPSITFALPRAVTVMSGSDRQQRTRIASFDAKARFVHVALPLLTEAVYLRGELTNTSPYQLLSGQVAIFVGQDYVGPTTLQSTPPGSEIKMHFGIDQSIRARRQLVSTSTENTGLLGGGRRINSAYRLTIDNNSGRAITLELWDRIPVSRSEEIQIQMIDLSTQLAGDAIYLAEQRPQGLLKWLLNVPSSARNAQAFTITYTVRIDRAKNVNMTPLPE